MIGEPPAHPVKPGLVDESSILGNQTATKQNLHHNFARKLPKNRSKFQDIAPKSEGLNKGYKAKDADLPDSPFFMIKEGEKHATVSATYNAEGQKVASRQDMIREFIVAPIYKRLLYDRTATISLVLEDSTQAKQPRSKLPQAPVPLGDSNKIFIRS